MTPPQRRSERDLATLLAPDIIETLDESPADIAKETEELHPADLADVAELLPRGRVAEFLRALPADRAADVMEYLDEDLRTEVLEAMSSTQAAGLLTAMTPDDRADALEELEEERADEILAKIPTEQRGETERLLAFEPDSAGGLMTTEFVSVPASMTVDEAIDAVRTVARAGRRESMYTVYVTDEQGRMNGVLSLRELLAAPTGTRVADLAWSEVVSVPPTADREQVADLTRKYDLVAVPVVDERGALLGVVTVDDIIDAIVDEQTEDVQKLGAVEPLEEPYFTASFWSILRKRGGWLVLLFVEEMLTGSALRHYQATIEAVTALTFFIPLIISSGGNSGSQSASLITRALAVGDVRMRDALRVFWRESGQGIFLGLFLGIVGFARALMWGNGTPIAAVIGLTLVFVILSGTVVGAMLPLVFTKLGFDPAIASSPFVASLVDVVGIVIYFNIAIAVLHVV
ncbi:MAG: magnesium transporter [Gemmatimonadota bacterium]|nr:magnesium transporter [Gemmatimonadota bacterium]